jgi:hypothetical protein
MRQHSCRRFARALVGGGWSRTVGTSSLTMAGRARGTGSIMDEQHVQPARVRVVLQAIDLAGFGEI